MTDKPVLPAIISEMIDNYIQFKFDNLRGVSATDIVMMIHTVNPDENRAEEMAAATVAWFAETTEDDFREMIEDWKADRDYSDLVIDDTNNVDGEWTAICHDKNTTYQLSVIDGNITLNYLDSRN